MKVQTMIFKISSYKSGDVEFVKKLLSHSEIDINERDGETFHLPSACAVGHVDIVQLLIS